MIKRLIYFVLTFFSIGILNAQYVEPEKADKEAKKRKESEVVTLPKQKFDSVTAKNALALGKGKITGVAFARKEFKDMKKFGDKVLASKVLIQLFPVTPYFEEYYSIWKDKSKNNPKKNRYVYMAPEAYRYRLEAITNSSGEFTFPDMKPGKYYIWANFDYSLTYNYNEYTGSGYIGNRRIDYYSPSSYDKNFSKLLELFVEVKADGEIVNVKLK